MPKSYFQLANTTKLKSLPKNCKVHFIGISGVAMGQLAAAMNAAGYQVSGGDKAYYCLLYTSPSPRDQRGSRMPSSA